MEYKIKFYDGITNILYSIKVNIEPTVLSVQAHHAFQALAEKGNVIYFGAIEEHLFC